MRAWFAMRLRAAIAAAATLTGKRFGLLVASSLVATSAIVAAAATSQPEASPLAAVLGTASPPTAPRRRRRRRRSKRNPNPKKNAAPEPTIEPAPGTVSIPEPLPEPVMVPEETAPEALPKKRREEEAVEEEPGRRRSAGAAAETGSGPGQARLRRLAGQPRLRRHLRQTAPDALPGRHAAPKGTLLTNYSVLAEASDAERDRGDRRPAAEQGDRRKGCPTFKEFPPTAKSSGRRRHRRRLRLPGRNADAADPAGVRPVHLARLHGRDGKPDHRRTGKLRPPRDRRRGGRTGGYSARLNPFAYFHSLLDLGSCSTEDVPITELKKDLKSEATRRTTPTSPRPLLRRRRRAVPGRGAGKGPPAADAWLAEMVPEILESPAYKATAC